MIDKSKPTTPGELRRKLVDLIHTGDEIHDILAKADQHGPMYDVVTKDGTKVINLVRKFDKDKPQVLKDFRNIGANDTANAVENYSIDKSITSGLTCSAGPLKQHTLRRQGIIDAHQ